MTHRSRSSSCTTQVPGVKSGDEAWWQVPFLLDYLTSPYVIFQSWLVPTHEANHSLGTGVLKLRKWMSTIKEISEQSILLLYEVGK